MNVICTKSTSKLIKGATYRVVFFSNLNTKGYAFFRPTLRIYLNDNLIQTFPLSNFKPVDSEDFPQTNWICPDYQIILNEREQTKIDKNLKSGDFVIPVHDGLRTLVKGKKYKVSEVDLYDHKSTTGQVRWTDIKIKLEGSSRFYASFNFRKCTNQEVREIGLSQIFEEDVKTVKVNEFKRKFDYYTEFEKKKLLLGFLIESANDRSRHQMDVIDWAISKTSNKFKLQREDFELVGTMSLMEALNSL